MLTFLHYLFETTEDHDPFEEIEHNHPRTQDLVKYRRSVRNDLQDLVHAMATKLSEKYPGKVSIPAPRGKVRNTYVELSIIPTWRLWFQPTNPNTALVHDCYRLLKLIKMRDKADNALTAAEQTRKGELDAVATKKVAGTFDPTQYDPTIEPFKYLDIFRTSGAPRTAKTPSYEWKTLRRPIYKVLPPTAAGYSGKFNLLKFPIPLQPYVNKFAAALKRWGHDVQMILVNNARTKDTTFVVYVPGIATMTYTGISAPPQTQFVYATVTFANGTTYSVNDNWISRLNTDLNPQSLSNGAKERTRSQPTNVEGFYDEEIQRVPADIKKMAPYTKP